MFIIKIRSILVLLVFLPSITASAQDHKRSNQYGQTLSFSLLLNRAAFADEFFSSGPYRSWVPHFVASYCMDNVKQRQYFNAGFITGKFTNDNNSDYTANQQSFVFEYSRLYNVLPAAKNVKVLVGGNFGLVYNNRKYKGFINSDESFEFVSSLDAAAEVEFLISEKNDLRLYVKEKLRLPFLSLLYQPSYSTEETTAQLDGKKGLTNFFSSSKLASFDKYFSAANTLSFTKEISPTTDLSFQYDLLYHKIATQRSVKHLNHSIGIALAFHL